MASKSFWRHPLTTMILGVIGSVLTAVILNALGKIEIRIPKTERLDGFSAVLTKAASIIEKSDSSVSIATDVAAMGFISANESYLKYHAALQKAKSRPGTVLDIVWLKAEDERKVMEAQGVTGNKAREALKASAALRGTLAGTGVRERTLPSLMFFYFWTGEETGGATESVIAFNDGMNPTDPVTGFFSNSKDVHKALARVQTALKSDTLEGEVLKSFEQLTGCIRPK